MTSFDEAKHNRESTGRFSPKVGGMQEGSLSDQTAGNNGVFDEAASGAAAGEPADDSVVLVTGAEAMTLHRASPQARAEMLSRLQAGIGDGFRPTGLSERREIVDQIGRGTVAAISGGRVVPLPDGVELPVSNGYSVRVRLAADDTYTVDRLFRRAGNTRVKGSRDGVYADEVSEVAYRAGMFHSYDETEWTTS